MPPILSPSLLSVRRHPQILKLPPYISLLVAIVGIAWLFLLPLDSYSRQTYVSENALLPGQVHTYFSGSEQNIYRGFRAEVEDIERNADIADPSTRFREIFKSFGLKVATQKYKYHSAGQTYAGENVYALIRAPRGDGTEAIVLLAPWVNPDGKSNKSGVALLLTLSRYFQRWSLWSKDIIFLITSDSKAGPQAWVDAYHNAHNPAIISSLPLKSGALQGALVIDHSLDHNFNSIHILYDGVNGQLPNLDLINTAVAIASGQMGIGMVLQRMWQHDDSYKQRLQTMARGMVSQALGHASGPHSSFIPYHVDAITLQTVGDGWQDEMALGRTVESLVRSLNNLLEHLHQSFFFYLLMQANRFVSIGTYLPSAMLVAANFTIMAISLWISSGIPPTRVDSVSANGRPVKCNEPAKAPTESTLVAERRLSQPLVSVLTSHLLSFLPLLLFNATSARYFEAAFAVFSLVNAILPFVRASIINPRIPVSSQRFVLMKSFTLLLLGMFLSALATLNFSLAFLIGVLATPLTFVPLPPTNRALAMLYLSILSLVSPPTVLFAASRYWNMEVGTILKEAAFGWDVWGMWSPIAVWCIWWPAWLMGATLAACSVMNVDEPLQAE